MAGENYTAEALSGATQQQQASSQAFTSGANAMTAGMNAGTQMAQAMVANKQKQAETQRMQDELNTHKYNNMMGAFDTYSKMDPKVQNAMQKVFEKKVQENGGDPSILGIIKADPVGYQQKLSSLSDIASKDPQKRNLALQAFSSAEQFHQGADVLGDTVKTSYAQALKEQQIEANTALMKAKLEQSNTNNQRTTDAMKSRFGPGSPQQVRAEMTAGKNYESYIKPYEQTLNAADQLKTTLKDIDEGKLSDAKNVKAEIETKIASVFGGGGKPTVFGTQAVGLDSLYGDFENHLNKILGQAHGVLTEAQKDQIKQELKTFGANAAKQHEDAFLTHKEIVNDAYLPKIQNSYETYRARKGLPGLDGQVHMSTPSGAAGAPPAEAASVNTNDPNYKAYIANLQGHPGFDQAKADATWAAINKKGK